MGFFRFITTAVLAVFIPLSSFALGGKDGISTAGAAATPVVVVSIIVLTLFSSHFRSE